jgi:hypothetical protein
MGAGASSSSSEAPKERRASTCKLARQLSQTDFAEGLPDFLDEDDLRHLLKDKFDKAKFDAVKSDVDELVSREQLIKLVEEWRQSMIVDALGSATLQNIDVENIMTTCEEEGGPVRRNGLSAVMT